MLIKNNIVGIQGIDTRYITSLIRDKGYINGMIINEPIANNEIQKLIIEDTTITREKLRIYAILAQIIKEKLNLIIS